MQAGQLASRITLQRRTTATDTLNQPLDTWVTVATVWANIRYQSGTAAIKADREASVNRVSIRIRFRTDVVDAMHATFGTTVFLIRAVNPQGREWLDLVCEVVS